MTVGQPPNIPGQRPGLHAVTSAVPASTVPSTNPFLGTVSKKTLRAHDGKIAEIYLKDMFKSFEGDLGVWTRRSLPTPAANIECITIKKTCTNIQVFESIGIHLEELAFRRQQVALFAQENESVLPRTGHGGVWMLYWEGADLWFAYLYLMAPSQVGMIPFPLVSPEAQVLPAHHYHTIVIPERK